MSLPPPPPKLPDSAPELAQRFGMILAGLAALVARRFLRDPQFMALIVPLWGWLGRTARRLERAVLRPVPMPVATPVAPTVSRHVIRATAPNAARFRLPARRAWLLKALGWEAAGFGCQLEALLAEPDMQALLAGRPGLGRLLRPLCRMLGMDHVPAARVLASAPRAKRPAQPRPPRPPRNEPVRPGWERPITFTFLRSG